MAGIKRRLGSLLGPQGRVPQLVEGTTTQLAPSEPARVTLTKTGDAEYRVDAWVPRGLDGDPTAVANFGEAMAAEVNTPGSTGRQAFNVATAQVVYDVPGPTGTVQGDIDLVLAACDAAASEGRTTVTMGPGHYQLDGLTVSDIQDRYLVGDHVTFTWQSNVYPFTSDDLATLSANRGRQGGRGRIAIEVDDALISHWRYLFPASKRLGITMGTAWHTDNGAEWVAEAYRHGWEVIAHLPENITAVEYLNRGELDEAAQSCVAMIEQTIGRRDGIGFVYPQHVRSNETDRILSKYFTRGRGHNDRLLYPKGVGHSWFTTATALDSYFTDGDIDPRLESVLRDIASNDGSMVFYMHLNDGNQETQIASLTKMVNLCRFLGIDIVNPAQIWPGNNAIQDPYLSKPSSWTLNAHTEFDTTEAYHGERSLKFLPTGNNQAMGDFIYHSPLSGHFAAYRVSFRYKTAEPFNVSSVGQGFRWLISLAQRIIGSPIQPSTPLQSAAMVLPVEDVTVPAANWDKVQAIIYIPPHVTRITPALALFNAVDQTEPVWVDELRWEFLEHTPMAVFDLQLQGTGNAIINTTVPEVGKYDIRITPETPPEGTVYIHSASESSNQIILRSTSPEDIMRCRITITPRSAYRDLELPKSGA